MMDVDWTPFTIDRGERKSDESLECLFISNSMTRMTFVTPTFADCDNLGPNIKKGNDFTDVISQHLGHSKYYEDDGACFYYYFAWVASLVVVSEVKLVVVVLVELVVVGVAVVVAVKVVVAVAVSPSALLGTFRLAWTDTCDVHSRQCVKRTLIVAIHVVVVQI